MTANCKHKRLQRSGTAQNGLIRLWQCKDCTQTFRDKKPLVTLNDLEEGWTSKEEMKENEEFFRGVIYYS